MVVPKIIVVGGGFAGMNFIKKLKHARADIVLIDSKNHHVFQPLLYQVATATLPASDITMSFREIFARQQNVSIILGEVSSINIKKQVVVLASGQEEKFDYLVVGIGARHSYFGNDHWASMAPGIKTVADAITIRERLLSSFEIAERLGKSAASLNFVIIGGGPTGVEFAGTIAELKNKTLRNNFRKITPSDASIFLIEGLDRLLPPFHEKLSARTRSDLEKMGVTVLTNTMVQEISEKGVIAAGEFIPSRNIIWAAGNMAPPLLASMGVPCDRQNRIIVTHDLSVEGHPNIFVIGDSAHVKDANGSPLPSMATVAIQEGCFVGKLLYNEIAGKKNKYRQKGFKLLDKGYLAVIGGGKAVGQFAGIRLYGIIGWSVWATIHIMYLVPFHNRLIVTIRWLSHHFFGARRARILYDSIEDACKGD